MFLSYVNNRKSTRLQVSGIDEGMEEEEVFAAAQEGLATAFELGSKDAVTVGAAGTLDQEVEPPSRRRLALPEMADTAPTPWRRRLGAAPLAAAYSAEIGGGGYPGRRLQEGTSNGTTVEMDFEIGLPTDSDDGQSAAVRAAAVVNDYADGGVVLALADSLGVEPSEVRYCTAACVPESNNQAGCPTPPSPARMGLVRRSPHLPIPPRQI